MYTMMCYVLWCVVLLVGEWNETIQLSREAISSKRSETLVILRLGHHL